MKNLTYVYQTPSKKVLQFSVMIEERILNSERIWSPCGPRKNYQFSDLQILANLTQNKDILQTAVEEEITIRKNEGYFFSPNDSIKRIRISPQKTAKFIHQATNKGLLILHSGTKMLVKNTNSQLEIKENQGSTSNSTLSCSVEKIPLHEFSAIYDSSPVVAIKGHEIYILPLGITKKLINSLPHNKQISLKDKENLFNRLKTFKSSISIIKGPSEKKIIKNPPIYPLLKFSKNFQFANLFFQYPENQSVNALLKAPSLFVEESNTEIQRNLEEEKFYQQELLSLGWIEKKVDLGHYYVPSHTLFSSIKQLENEGWEVYSEDSSITTQGQLHFSISSSEEQILFEGKIKIEGKNLPIFSQLNNLSLNQFNYGENKILLLDPDQVNKMGAIFHEGQMEDNQLCFPKSHFSVLETVKNDFPASEIPEELEEYVHFDRTIINAPLKLPQKLNKTLRPFQKEGVKWLHTLHRLNFSGILADDMGLGKTLQALTFLYNQISLSQPKQNFLIITPKTLIYNWANEIKKFMPDLSFKIHSGLDRSDSLSDLLTKPLLLTSYPITLRDFSLLKQHSWTMIILDESQNIKNPQAKITRAVSSLKSKYKLCLTGTPVENHPEDLWSQFNFLKPEVLGDLESFKSKYSKANADSMNRLHKILRPYILRRMKEDVLTELPEKTEITLFPEMVDSQKSLYQEILSSGKKLFFDQDNKTPKTMEMLEVLLRLRQISCHPALYQKDSSPSQDWSGKTQCILETSDPILDGGHKILIFSQFTTHLKIIKKAYQSIGISPLYLDGQTKNKEEIIEQFKNTAKGIPFLISLKVGGTGLNLTEADYVFLIDPWWNPAWENQAVDRSHRMGQKQPVTVYRFISKDSIEEKVRDLQMEKQKMGDQILSNLEEATDLSLDLLEKLLK